MENPLAVIPLSRATDTATPRRQTLQCHVRRTSMRQVSPRAQSQRSNLPSTDASIVPETQRLSYRQTWSREPCNARDSTDASDVPTPDPTSVCRAQPASARSCARLTPLSTDVDVVRPSRGHHRVCRATTAGHRQGKPTDAEGSVCCSRGQRLVTCKTATTTTVTLPPVLASGAMENRYFIFPKTPESYARKLGGREREPQTSLPLKLRRLR
jgi:hypothetical protein